MFDSERFWGYVDKKGPDDCWPWTGCKSTGYGQFYYKGRMQQAHRMAWAIHTGVFPSNHIRQICNNKLCCNPAHLRSVTHTDSMQAAMKAGTHVFANQKGENHTQAKLTNADVLEIRRLGTYLSALQISHIYTQVSLRHINYILARKRWSHI